VKYRLEATGVTAYADAEMVVPHSLDVTCKTTTLQATAQSLAVSVLDLVATRAGEAPGTAISRSVELARQVEQIGIQTLLGKRLWRTDCARRSWDRMQPCTLGWRDWRVIRVPMR
jgi:hypothetical protein